MMALDRADFYDAELRRHRALPLGEPLGDYGVRIEARPAVQAALHREAALNQVSQSREVR